MAKFQRFSILIFTLLILGQMLMGQRNTTPPVTLETPHNTVHVHLFFLQSENYDPAKSAQTFPPDIDSIDRVELAEQLKEIYDGHGLFVRLNQIPRSPNYMDSAVMQNVFTPFPQEMSAIYLEKIDDQWYYSHETANAIPKLYDDLYPFGTEFLMELVPQWSKNQFGGLKIWQWLGILLILLLGWLVHSILKRIFRPIIQRQILKRLHLVDTRDQLAKLMARAASLVVTFMLISRVYPALQLPVRLAEFTRVAIHIVIAVLVGVLIYRVLKIGMAYLKKAAEGTDTKMDDQILPVIGGMFTVLLIIGVLFYILSVMHVNVAALIAGLSIGGIALALAAQDTVKNLLGSIMVFLDQPFQVGDFVEVDGEYGTVVEVGFRSTRIMTKDTSIVSVPNGLVANMKLRNLGIRFYRLLETEISLTYDTPPELIEQFVDGIRHIFRIHPRTVKEDQYVYFSKMADSSLNIFIRTHIDTMIWDEELEIKEGLYLDIIRMAQEMGIRFAFPSRTLYIEDFPEKKTLVPDYEEEKASAEEKRNAYLDKLEQKYDAMGTSGGDL